jgi:hypothetical protein
LSTGVACWKATSWRTEVARTLRMLYQQMTTTIVAIAARALKRIGRVFFTSSIVKPVNATIKKGGGDGDVSLTGSDSRGEYFSLS